MDKRTLIIVTGLLLPLIVLAFLAQETPPAASVARTDAAAPPQTLEEARAQARIILDTLNHMTPQEWAAEQARRAQKLAPPANTLVPEQPKELPAPQAEDEKN